MENIHANFDNKIKSLDLKFEVGTVTIKRGEKFAFDAKKIAENSFQQMEVVNETLVISQKASFWNSPFSYMVGEPYIQLTVPPDFYPEEFTLKIGAGSVDIVEIPAKKIDILVKAGSATIDKMNSEKAKITCETGKIFFTNSILKNSDVNCSVGQIAIQGELLGDNYINSKVGGINLNLSGNIDDYFINCKSQVGNVRVNGQSSFNYYANRHAENIITASTSVGKININIK
ncbi:MAG: DUF4097 family beta strand repeat-containing protein [Oscillospiraceae bacterium]